MTATPLTTRLLGARSLTPSVRELTLQRLDGLPLGHLPGQWIALDVPTDEGASRAFFSIASPPSEGPSFRLAVALSDSAPATRALTRLPPGALLQATGPGGTMVRVGDDPTPTVFVGAGTGCAPLVAMCEEAWALCSTVPRVLVLGARRARDLLYTDALARQCLDGAPLEVLCTLTQPEPWWTGPTGRVQAHWERALRALEARAGERARVIACGPEAMVRAVRERALALGLSEDRVVTER